MQLLPELVHVGTARVPVLAVLALMAQGRSNAWIAAHLRLSEKAVVKHTSNLYDALGLQMDADDHRRVLAVVRYLSR